MSNREFSGSISKKMLDAERIGKTIGSEAFQPAGKPQTRLFFLSFGLILAEAGLIRLGMEERISYRFDPHLFTPAPGQGVIALETRVNDHAAQEICEAINDSQQHMRATIEMEFLKVLGLDCKAPVGAFTFVKGGKIHLKVFVANPEMTAFFEEEVMTTPKQRISCAQALGEKCLQLITHLSNSPNLVNFRMLLPSYPKVVFLLKV
ncbi:MAG: hypothetical protein WB791_09575 [Waddliaceae bacterium]